MFAYALWDARRKSLLLVRDRFGKKPLYYRVIAEGFYFGSELKCLRAAGVPLELDPEAIRLYTQFSYIPDPWTRTGRFAKFRRVRGCSATPTDERNRAAIGRCLYRRRTFSGLDGSGRLRTASNGFR